MDKRSKGLSGGDGWATALPGAKLRRLSSHNALPLPNTLSSVNFTFIIRRKNAARIKTQPHIHPYPPTTFMATFNKTMGRKDVQQSCRYEIRVPDLNLALFEKTLQLS